MARTIAQVPGNPPLARYTAEKINELGEEILRLQVRLAELIAAGLAAEKHHEINVYTLDGKEGRFLEWRDGSWQAFEYYNYRHSFGAAQLPGDGDCEALRQSYRIAADALSDQQLIGSSPDALQKISS